MSSPGEIDYSSLGLRVGLEIHVQLDTANKLFCNCPTKLVEDGEESAILRELRPVRSEVGEVDPAALLEWQKGKKFKYLLPREASCLVEADEEPPHPINREALSVALALAIAMNMKVVDEIYVMRKVVIDGSNVSGFQRTALIALNGHIDVDGRRISIQTLCLEEDAARKMEETSDLVVYKLDRMGIPLVEIATAPDISDPEQAGKVALKIGQLVRMTMKAKRGLGTIRQDINVSIRGGAKTEIKGIQHLSLIPAVVKYEVQRQLRLLELKKILGERGLKKDDVRGEPVEVTALFVKTQSKLIKKSLSEGAGVFALGLPGFKGLLGFQLQPGRRFGTELADYARVWAKVGGIIHSDELPAYGITQEEVNAVYKFLGLDPDRDAFVLVVDTKDKALRALSVVAERVRAAFDGVPEETRAANPDGTTRYMRPRPGGARMYPETDIPPIVVDQELLEEASKYVPEPYDVKLKKYQEEFGLSGELAAAVLDDLRADLFERLAKRYAGVVSPQFIASLMTNTLRMLKNEGAPVENIEDEHIEKVVALVASGSLAKEAVPEVLRRLAANPQARVEEVVKELGLARVGEEEAARVVDEVVGRLAEKLKQRPEKAFNIAMSEAMKVLRGKIDGAIVAGLVRRKLRELGID